MDPAAGAPPKPELIILERSDPSTSYGFTLQYQVVRSPSASVGLRTAGVQEIQADSPAAVAGLREGQRILCVDDTPVDALPYDALIRHIHKSGRRLSLMVLPSADAHHSLRLPSGQRPNDSEPLQTRIDSLLQEMRPWREMARDPPPPYPHPPPPPLPPKRQKLWLAPRPAVVSAVQLGVPFTAARQTSAPSLQGFSRVPQPPDLSPPYPADPQPSATELHFDERAINRFIQAQASLTCQAVASPPPAALSLASLSPRRGDSAALFRHSVGGGGGSWGRAWRPRPIDTGLVASHVHSFSADSSIKDAGSERSGDVTPATSLPSPGRSIKSAFLDGSVESVSDMRLSHAQTAKRELTKVIYDGGGRVAARARRWDSAPVSPALATSSPSPPQPEPLPSPQPIAYWRGNRTNPVGDAKYLWSGGHSDSGDGSLRVPASSSSAQDDVNTAKDYMAEQLKGSAPKDPAQRWGWLGHCSVPLGQRSSSSGAEWRRRWAALTDARLRLSSDPKGENGDWVSVRGCIVDISYDAPRPNVLRLSTQDQKEHLLEAESHAEMLSWISDLQRASSQQGSSGRGDAADVDGESMALILKRYEARQANGKKALRLPTHSAPLTSDQHPDPKLDKKEEVTPGRVRKAWRKRVMKSGSCPAPSAASAPAAFNTPLSDCPTSAEDDFVPLVVRLCVKVVEAHGLDTVGIYRIPGNTAAVNTLMHDLDRGFEHVNFSDPRWKDVNVVSSLLKGFFRKLPDPLLTDRYYPFFIDANRVPDHGPRITKLRTLIHKLPRHNFETLRFLAIHLHRVASKCSVNKMEARNLALMFGPSVVRPSGDNMSAMVSHMSDQCKLAESFIVYADWLFAEPAAAAPIPEQRIPSASTGPTDVMTTSFSDMSDLLKRVNKAEDELDRRGDSIVKTILNVRRGSRKSGRGSQSRDRSLGAKGRSVLSRGKANSDRPVVSLPTESAPAFQERDIDAEIARAKTSASDESRDEPEDPNKPNELTLAVEEMRRRREENIYTARRIFIGGIRTEAESSDTGADDAKVSGLGKHMRHLNITGPSQSALDVLSPETREKIKKLQTEGSMIKDSRRPNRTSGDARYRRRLEAASWSQREPVSELRSADNPAGSVDALSLTSDYSTTSSLPPERNGYVEPIGNGVAAAFTSSDYSSTGASSPRLGSQRQPQPLAQSSSSVASLLSSEPSPPIPPVRSPRAWYESEEEETTPVGGGVARAGSTRESRQPDKPVSRISQKIRFRSRGASEKRKDPRRHTLTDLDAVKSAVFDAAPKHHSGTDTDSQTSGKGSGKTRTGRLKAWFKESFRKSSPELYEIAPVVNVLT